MRCDVQPVNARRLIDSEEHHLCTVSAMGRSDIGAITFQQVRPVHRFIEFVAGNEIGSYGNVSVRIVAREIVVDAAHGERGRRVYGQAVEGMDVPA